MFKSLEKIKELPLIQKFIVDMNIHFKIQNFVLTHDKNNENLKNKIKEIKKKLQENLPTIPSTIKEELECNIFLRAKNVETFSKLRDLKDNF